MNLSERGVGLDSVEVSDEYLVAHYSRLLQAFLNTRELLAIVQLVSFLFLIDKTFCFVFHFYLASSFWRLYPLDLTLNKLE